MLIANKTILQASFTALSIICIAIIADSIAKLKKVIMVNGTVMNATAQRHVKPLIPFEQCGGSEISDTPFAD